MKTTIAVILTLLLGFSSFAEATTTGSGSAPVPATRAKKPIWSPGKPKSPVKNAKAHADKHGSEFSHQNSKQYVDAVHKFLKNPPKGTLHKVRKNGEHVYYNKTSNTLVVTEPNGTPKTMFKPDPKKHRMSSNLAYYNAQ